MSATRPPFWQRKHLEKLDPGEWESVCDGCGRCCLVKLEDADTGEVHYTDVACRLLDTESCRCTEYENRGQMVPTCIVLSADTIGDYRYLPKTCAYRLLDHGAPLPYWHPLVSDNPDSVHEAGISVRGKVISELYVDESELEGRITDWPVKAD